MRESNFIYYTYQKFIYIESDSEITVEGIIVGAVVGGLVQVCALILMVVSIYLLLKWRKKQRVKSLQMDILARYGS